MEHDKYYNFDKNNLCSKCDWAMYRWGHLPIKNIALKISFFETGVTDHYHLLYLTLKTTFAKEEPKNVTFRNYKQFRRETFEKDLTSSLKTCNGGYKNEQRNFIKLLSTHTPQKVKISKGNHKPHYKKIWKDCHD